MKYEILVEGGFAGITKKYEGNLNMTSMEKRKLLQMLDTPQEQNENLRDGFRYSIRVEDRNKIYNGYFDDGGLPSIFRKLLV